MLERVIDRLRGQAQWLVVSVAENSEPNALSGLPLTRDSTVRFGGPLFGILSGLKWARCNTDAKWIVSAPTDAPFLPSDLVFRLRQGLAPDAEVTVARSLGHLHPVIALWPVSSAEALESWIAVSSQRAVKAWLATRKWSAVDFPCEGSVDPFFNVNTPEDLIGAREYVRQSS